MALNSSNATHYLPLPSSSTIYNFTLSCFHSKVGTVNMMAFTIISILFLPLYMNILYCGLQQWQQHQSTASMRHSDFITYNVAIIELVNVFGSIICCCGIYANLPMMISVGVFMFPLRLTVQMLFHILTCVERYLAVVHPVTYLALKTKTGIRVRNIISGCAWGLSFFSMSTNTIVDKLSMIVVASSTIGICVLLFSFFSISVLCVLIRPRPGDRANDRQGVDQSKLRAFYTIMFILGVLLLKAGSNMLTLLKIDLLDMGENERCGLWFSIYWFCLPSSLVLPLLFVQRQGKLSLCKKNTNTNRTSN